jgi:TM2 domain-containing membrane protein YozV
VWASSLRLLDDDVAPQLECCDKEILTMPHVITYYLPELDEPEQSFIAQLTARMSDRNVQQFAIAYRTRRKDPQTVLLLAAIGMVSIPGLHRFALGEVGIGLLYLFTGGLLLIGTIVDMVKHKELAFSYNRQVARRIASNLQPRVNFG